ncbi:MAG: hypothetical protein KAW12_10100 [Candidatus Aminicenantes bacterium]|nr:hypothetical protein [Candidatus Aminicenantes bacterium]
MVKRKPNIVGWSLNDITQVQIKKIAIAFKLKKVRAIHKIFDILFEELAEKDDFREFVEIYDRLQERELASETSIYVSFDIDKDYMKSFEETMYRFDFLDRSPFFRIMVDYVYREYCVPAIDILPEIKEILQAKGYKVKNITPALLGDIFIQVENPKSHVKETLEGIEQR